MSGIENSGNYLELLQLLAKYDPVLAAHLSSKRSRGKYTSPQIQNEMINSIATVIRNRIIAEIQNAKFYCIILDTIKINLLFRSDMSEMKSHLNVSFGLKKWLKGSRFSREVTTSAPGIQSEPRVHKRTNNGWVL